MFMLPKKMHAFGTWPKAFDDHTGKKKNVDKKDSRLQVVDWSCLGRSLSQCSKKIHDVWFMNIRLMKIDHMESND